VSHCPSVDVHFRNFLHCHETSHLERHRVPLSRQEKKKRKEKKRKGKERTGQDRTGQDKTRQDKTRQDMTDDGKTSEDLKLPSLGAFLHSPPLVQEYLLKAGHIDVDEIKAGGDVTLRRFLYAHGRPHPCVYALLPDQSNAAFVAVYNGAESALKALLGNADRADRADRRVNLELVFDAWVGTVLLFAARWGPKCAWAVPMLLDAGASPQYVTPAGETCMGAAAVGGSVPVIQALSCRVSAAAVNATAATLRRTNSTPLDAAIVAMHGPEVVEALLAAGADPNLPSDGCPPAGRALLVGALTPSWVPTMKAVLRVLLGANRTDVDRVWPALQGSVRALAAANGIHI
jgi:hypothetical protein